MRKKIGFKITSAKIIVLSIFQFSFCSAAWSQEIPEGILFKNVMVFDGKNPKLLTNQYVLVKENKIVALSDKPLEVGTNTLVIDGKGKTLMPGLIDVHVHMIFGALTMKDMMSPDIKPENLFAKIIPASEKMLLRGFTSVRDLGGPVFPLKQAIDKGTARGPRVWPSGAMISQTSGHGDLRTPDERSRRFFGPISRAEHFGASFIADGRDEVLTAVRENLRSGASQIKLMAGGGTSSAYDHVTQYTFDEMKAAVESAEDWGTYVTVHAYTPRAIQRAIKAGVKYIEHGQLLDKETLKMIKKNKVWLSTQYLVDNTPDMDAMRIEKRKPVIEGQQLLWSMAKKLKLKLA